MGMAVLVVSALAGGSIAWQFTEPPARLADVAHGQPATSAPAPSSPSAPAPAPVSSAPVSSAPAPAPVSSAPVSSAPPASSPAVSASPAGVTVTIGPGAADRPDAARVATFMVGYFDAINQRDYQSYLAAFDEQARPDYSRQKFLAEFGTTTDTAPSLTALSTEGAGLLATVTFTSHQSPAKSFTHTACTAWTLRLYLEASGTSYLIGQPPPGSPRTTALAC
jgi:hypothetical protein